MILVIQQIINGCAIGLIYGLMGLGFSIIWGTASTINLGHGGIYSLGGYLGVTVVVLASNSLGSGGAFGAAFLMAATIGAFLGIIYEKGLFKPLRMAPPIAPLLASLGIGLAAFNAIGFIWDTETHGYPNILPSTRLSLLGASITYTQLCLMGILLVITVAVYLFLFKTRMGTAMRATSWDQKAAQLVGIDINKTILLSFLLASLLGGISGFVGATYYGVVYPFMGYGPAIKGLTAAIFGGFGNPMGAVLGGLLLGVLEALGTTYAGSGWKDVFAYAILVAIIIFRPEGLLGKKVGGIG